MLRQHPPRRKRYAVKVLTVAVAVVAALGGGPAAAQQATPTSPAGADAALPSGALLPGHRIVAYYGNPLAPVLGALGEPPPDAMMARLKEAVGVYTAADPARPALPALELITPLAQSSPGNDGLYRSRMAPETIEQVAGWASDNDMLLILDVQVGRSSVADEVQALLPYLKRPRTHLALDPEFDMPSGQLPGQELGSMNADEINGAIGTLAQLVADNQLPPKLLIVHRFTPSMVSNASAIKLDPRVQVVIDMDGFGGPDAKISKYNAFVRDAGVQFGGIKLFYKQDTPRLMADDVLALDPPPDVVIYQ